MKPVDLIGSFETRDFPSFRNPTIANADGKPFDTLTWGRQRHHIPILVEIDVTEARSAIHALKAKTGQGMSFTGWIVKCLAQAVSEHKYVHALRNGQRQLVIFDDVDVSIVIREYVGLTVMFDHDVTDGAPVARFIKRLQELTLGRYGLEEVSASDSHDSKSPD